MSCLRRCAGRAGSRERVAASACASAAVGQEREDVTVAVLLLEAGLRFGAENMPWRN